MTADQLVLGQNLVWIFFSSTVAIFFAWTAWPRFCAEGFSRGVRVMVGVSMVGVGCACASIILGFVALVSHAR